MLAHARNAPGVAVQRTLVTLALLKHWAVSLPRDATALAQAMLTALAQAASDVGQMAATDRKIADAALKGLSEVAQARPEFIAPAAGAVADAVVAQVMKADIMTAGDALLLAIEAVESFDARTLATLADTTLRRLTTFDPAQSPWPFVRPAIAFLSSPRVLALCAKDASLRERLPQTVIEFALESESEHASLLYLLRDLDPAWLEGRVDTTRLVEVISELRQRAHMVNSSGAPEDVMALLVAPAFSGADGVRDALEALQAIVRSAAGDRPAISFERAYLPVKPLRQNATAIAQATRFAAGEPAPFDVESVRRERKEPFYAALGQRLLLLAELPPAVREEVTAVLVEQCLHLGPSGLDAGVFTAAIAVSVMTRWRSAASRR